MSINFMECPECAGTGKVIDQPILSGGWHIRLQQAHFLLTTILVEAECKKDNSPEVDALVPLLDVALEKVRKAMAIPYKLLYIDP